MALRGNLRDFSLPDVFQLVTFSRKTGVLRIAREDGAQGSVWFRDGDVFFASSNWHSEPLGERLVKGQRITPQALDRALKIRSTQGEGGKRLGQILIDEGYITEKVLEAFVSDQIQDTIFDLMRWDEGEFDFEAMPDVVDEDIGLAVSIENVVMEGARRLEEWNRIRKKIPSVDVVFKMATAPGEGTFEISLKPIEWQLLLLIDGSRSVAELAEATGRTDFEVARIIYGLFSAGLLEFAAEEEIEHARAERAVREAKLAAIAAERKVAEDAARAEALERETRLAEEAEERRRRQQAEEAAVAAPEEPAFVRTEPEEEPEFLGGGATAPTAEDEAVLEAFMGAVLHKPEDEPAELSVEPVAETPVAPYVPVEEPAFMGVETGDEAELTLVPVPSVEDLLGGPQEPYVEPLAPFAVAPVGEPEVAVEPEVQAVPEVPEVQAEPEVAAEPEGPLAAPEGPVDEVSSELIGILESLGAEEAEPEVSPYPGIAEPASVVEPTEASDVPESQEAQEPAVFVVEPSDAAVPFVVEPPLSSDETPDFERDLLALGLGELPSDLLEPTAPAAAEAEPEIEPTPGSDEVADDFDALGAELGLSGESALAGLEPREGEEEPDFSALLESLDVDHEAEAPAPVAIVEPASPEDAGFDLELLQDEGPAPTAAVISTDAFLEDISIDDIGFSGGLGDELSALTGAERRAPGRPQANVNPIPEETAGGLRRDARVDKDTVLKIIDGIKSL
jgi:hypothetical protein